MANLQSVETDVADLVRRAGEGDEQSWKALVDRFASMVLAVSRGCGLAASDAADVSQTTWLRLVQHLDRIEHPERIGGWLATTARRESLRVLRMSGRQIPTGGDAFTELGDLSSTALDANLLQAERAEALAVIFAELPHRCKCILRSLVGDTAVSYEELSRLLDMPIGSIGPTRARCLERLRRLAAGLGLGIGDATR